MSAVPWHEIEESFRLTGRHEWWVPAEFAVGALAYVAWVALTWRIALEADAMLGEAVLGGTPTLGTAIPPTAHLGVLAVLWLLLPALVAIGRIRTHILNFRRNVDRFYRYERPGTLLVPPIVFFYVALIAWIVLEAVPWWLYVLLVAVTFHLLVRTLAFSYRVFAFSHPYLMHVIALVTLVLQVGVGLSYLAAFAGEDAYLVTVLEEYQLAWLLESTTVGGLDAQVGTVAAVAVPAALVAVYLVCQLGAAVVIRYVQPDVTPADIRGGQRYPPAVRTADGGGLAAGTARLRSPPSNSAAGSGTAGSATAGGSRSGSSGSGTASTADASDTAAGSGDTADDVADEGDAADDQEDGEADDEDIEEESVSHTRVFTPPADGDFEDVPDGTASGTTCESCGEQIPAHSDERFCPSCGREIV